MSLAVGTRLNLELSVAALQQWLCAWRRAPSWQLEGQSGFWQPSTRYQPLMVPSCCYSAASEAVPCSSCGPAGSENSKEREHQPIRPLSVAAGCAQRGRDQASIRARGRLGAGAVQWTLWQRGHRARHGWRGLLPAKKASHQGGRRSGSQGEAHADPQVERQDAPTAGSWTRHRRPSSFTGLSSSRPRPPLACGWRISRPGPGAAFLKERLRPKRW